MPYPSYKKCRSGHRHFHVTIQMYEASWLRHHFSSYKGLSGTNEVGHIWLGICTETGTSVTIHLGNRIFIIRVPAIAIVYDVITCNEINGSFVGIVMTGFDFAQCLLGRFSEGETGKIKGVFHYYAHPTCKEGVDLMVPSMKRQYNRVQLEGGVMCLKYCGSFIKTQGMYQALLRKITMDWCTSELRDVIRGQVSGSTPNSRKEDMK